MTKKRITILMIDKVLKTTLFLSLVIPFPF